MRIHFCRVVLAISTILYYVVGNNAYCEIQQNSINFSSAVTKIDTKKGPPNFPQWSPDGKEILYFTYRKNTGYALWKLSYNTFEPEIIASSVPSSVLDINKRKIAFVNDRNLCLVGITTGETKKITLPSEISNHAILYQMSWSPNGRYILLYVCNSQEASFWVYNTQSYSFTKIVDIAKFPDPRIDIYKVGWSSDSEKIVYPVISKDEVVYYVKELRGAKRKIFSVPSNLVFAEPTWTNKEYIFWYAYDKEKLIHAVEPDDFSEIYVYELKSKKLRNLHFDNLISAWYPVISPDGRLIVFYGKDFKKNIRLMLTDIDGGFLRVLDERVTPAQAPKWSPDSTEIVYDKLLDSGDITLSIGTVFRIAK